jgi:hypothetical protein
MPHVKQISASRNIKDSTNYFKIVHSVHSLYQPTPFIIFLCRHFFFVMFLFCSRKLSSVFVEFVLQGVHHNFEFVINSSLHIFT